MDKNVQQDLVERECMFQKGATHLRTTVEGELSSHSAPAPETIQSVHV